ncbi:MAG: NAD(P)H-dependent oxidoreductase [Proteobacteria bacterium]|nr:NAD(P)H-dependent oxidoreductase [Pseudomonadota bacterium]
MNLLHIDSSILGDHSVSRTISAAAVASLTAADPTLKVVRRDLSAQPPPHLTGEIFAARAIDPSQRTPDHDRAAAEADAILDEFLAADVVVIGAPMYNFGIPSQLKAWIDHIVVGGKTFRYGPNGVEGLAGGKRIILASARGGFYGPESPVAGLQHQESYLRGIFAFLGAPEIEVVGAEGVNIGPEQRQASLDAAVNAASGLAPALQAA